MRLLAIEKCRSRPPCSERVDRGWNCSLLKARAKFAFISILSRNSNHSPESLLGERSRSCNEFKNVKIHCIPRKCRVFHNNSRRKQFTVAAFQRRRMQLRARWRTYSLYCTHVQRHTRRFMALYINSKDAHVLVQLENDPSTLCNWQYNKMLKGEIRTVFLFSSKVHFVYNMNTEIHFLHSQSL